MLLPAYFSFNFNSHRIHHECVFKVYVILDIYIININFTIINIIIICSVQIHNLLHVHTIKIVLYTIEPLLGTFCDVN